MSANMKRTKANCFILPTTGRPHCGIELAFSYQYGEIIEPNGRAIGYVGLNICFSRQTKNNP
jgi:hypothetical protein